MITPVEFKTRFLATLPDLPPGIEFGLDEFVTFPEVEVDLLSISEADKAILKDSGLPANAAPFLSFGPKGKQALIRLSDLPQGQETQARYRLIGSNSYGDPLCIDDKTGQVVYLNHDDHMCVVFMNSTLCCLGLSLCACGKYMQDRNGARCLDMIREVDPRAVESGSFWAAEIRQWIEEDSDLP